MKGGQFERGDFDAYYRFSPAALALREAVRLKAVRDLDLDEPILDVGCGDGLFARLAYPRKQVWGIDINPTEIKRAQATASYKTLVCGNVCDVQLPEAFFGSAIANCSLEHVPNLPEALANIRRSLRSGAMFILIVPTPDWSRKLAIAEFLVRLGMSRVASAYADSLDRVFHHVHLEDEVWWNERLSEAGFEPLETRRIVSRAASWVFEALLPPSALGFVVKRFTGRWVLAPTLRNMTVGMSRSLVEYLCRNLPEDARNSRAEYVILARASEQTGLAAHEEGT